MYCTVHAHVLYMHMYYTCTLYMYSVRYMYMYMYAVHVYVATWRAYPRKKKTPLKTHTLFPKLPLALPCHSCGWWNYLRSDCGWKYCISQNFTFDKKLLLIMRSFPRGFNSPNNRLSCPSMTQVKFSHANIFYCNLRRKWIFIYLPTTSQNFTWLYFTWTNQNMS